MRLTCFTYTVILLTGILSICIYSAPIFAEDKEEKTPITVTAEVDSTSIEVGDRITYTITVDADKDIETKFPEFAESLGEFAVRDFGSEDKWRPGGRRFIQWYELDTYISGSYTIPEAIIKYKHKNEEEWDELLTDEVVVEVKSLLLESGQEGEIKDISGPVDFPVNKWVYITIGGVLLLLVLSVFTFVLFKRKKKRATVAPPRPAHEIAREALKALKRKDYIKQEKIEPYYVELSDVVRHYLENRFHLKAPEMTTEEFLNTVKDDKTLSYEHKSLLKDFLSQCDLVKFARYRPAENETDMVYESAERLIEQTKEAS